MYVDPVEKVGRESMRNICSSCSKKSYWNASPPTEVFAFQKKFLPHSATCGQSGRTSHSPTLDSKSYSYIFHHLENPLRTWKYSSIEAARPSLLQKPHRWSHWEEVEAELKGSRMIYGHGSRSRLHKLSKCVDDMRQYFGVKGALFDECHSFLKGTV